MDKLLTVLVIGTAVFVTVGAFATRSSRNDSGELRQDAWLSGASIWIRPVAPIANWADHAPTLAGWPSFTEEQGERILEKGTGPEGEELRPPMHVYHMHHDDARAIIGYLKSLPRSSQAN